MKLSHLQRAYLVALVQAGGTAHHGAITQLMSRGAAGRLSWRTTDALHRNGLLRTEQDGATAITDAGRDAIGGNDAATD